MGYGKYVLSALGGLALIALGYQKNQEAKQRNIDAQKLLDGCNNYIAQAQKAVDDRRKAMDNILQHLGTLKKNLIEGILPIYIDQLESHFVNFDIDDEVDGSYDYKKELKTIDELKRIIGYIRKSETEYDYLKADNDSKLVTFAIVGLGAVATTGLFTISNTLLTGSGAIWLFQAVPLALGTGFAITGFINNYNSIRNYERVLEYYQQTEQLSKKVVALCDSLDSLLSYVYEVDETLRRMAVGFRDFVNKFAYIYEHHGLRQGQKLDVRNLTIEERRFIKDSYILSQILYASYNLPLFSSEGAKNTNTYERLAENIADFVSLTERYA